MRVGEARARPNWRDFEAYLQLRANCKGLSKEMEGKGSTFGN